MAYELTNDHKEQIAEYGVQATTIVEVVAVEDGEIIRFKDETCDCPEDVFYALIGHDGEVQEVMNENNF